MFKRSIYKHYMCSVCFLCSLQDSLSLLLSHCSRPGRSCLAPPPRYYGSRTLWTIRHIGTHRHPKIIAQTLKKTDCLFVCKHLWFCLSPSSPLCTSYNDFYVTLVCVISNIQQIITVRSALLLWYYSFSALKFPDFSYHTNLLLLCSVSYTTVELWCTHLVHFSKWFQDTT